ncbi:Lar family restriction alleviation protein [Sinanaerobacter sp. ZZT-01]|uniref:Lar family restriction alleviation protein n=1 Tax=Sinanaerobacter sp. ZZT-01 TaxID=3111540 RepID=UPI002D76DF85|nr:Lar family restriction alleviation protein [Sinanaerobacter sp. ZZT-01]WRR93395.1 Lar family restriction alleviation protein [Sinanaerobacter sp. ZZT-01]
MNKLKPCPFCGAEAEYRQFANPKNFYTVVCTNCHCRTDGYNCSLDNNDAENKAMQAEKWNHRLQTSSEIGGATAEEDILCTTCEEAERKLEEIKKRSKEEI